MTIQELTEGWKPKNKAKHKSCQQRVKNRVSVWPSAYASAQVVQCYYGKKKKKSLKEIENNPEYLSIIRENYYNKDDRQLILELFDAASLSNLTKDLANQLKLPKGLDQLKNIGKKIVDKLLEKVKSEDNNVKELVAFCKKITSKQQVTNDEKIKAGLQLTRLILMISSMLGLTAATGGLGAIVINLIEDQIKSKGIEIALQYLSKITGVDIFKQISDIAGNIAEQHKVMTIKDVLLEAFDQSAADKALGCSVSKEDLQDALQVLKDWSYQVGAIWDVSIDKIWNNLVSNAKIVDINVNELQPHHDWGRRPSAAQMKNPIIIGKLIGGNYLVLDGQHRIIRAKELNKEKIQALVIELPLKYSKMLRRYSQVQGS